VGFCVCFGDVCVDGDVIWVGVFDDCDRRLVEVERCA